MEIKKAVIPAAGLGTRFLPFTKSSPKEMLSIVDKPTLQYIVEEIVNSGIREILIITGRNKKSIEDHFDRAIELESALKDAIFKATDDNKKAELEDYLKTVQSLTEMADVHFIRQKETLGLGHAIGCAAAFVGNQPFAVLLGDDVVYTGSLEPATKQLINAYNMTGKSVLGVQGVDKNEVSKYGIIDIKSRSGRLLEIKGFTEKPRLEDAKSNMAVLGRYIINPEIFALLKEQKPGVGGEIQLTDSLSKLIDKDAVCAYEFEGKRYDIGSKQGFLEATVEYALRDEKLSGAFTEYLKGVVKKL